VPDFGRSRKLEDEAVHHAGVVKDEAFEPGVDPKLACAHKAGVRVERDRGGDVVVRNVSL